MKRYGGFVIQQFTKTARVILVHVAACDRACYRVIAVMMLMILIQYLSSNRWMFLIL